jgi:hypothetical protein
MATLKNTIINGEIVIPSGTTAQRPWVATEGMLRYNTTTGRLEFYNGVSWVDWVF